MSDERVRVDDPGPGYEVVIAHGKGAQDVQPFAIRGEAIAAARRIFDADSLATMVFVRQYYFHRNGRVFRVLHKHTLRREL